MKSWQKLGYKSELECIKAHNTSTIACCGLDNLQDKILEITEILNRKAGYEGKIELEYLNNEVYILHSNGKYGKINLN